MDFFEFLFFVFWVKNRETGDGEKHTGEETTHFDGGSTNLAGESTVWVSRRRSISLRGQIASGTNWFGDLSTLTNLILILIFGLKITNLGETIVAVGWDQQSCVWGTSYRRRSRELEQEVREIWRFFSSHFFVFFVRMRSFGKKKKHKWNIKCVTTSTKNLSLCYGYDPVVILDPIECFCISLIVVIRIIFGYSLFIYFLFLILFVSFTLLLICLFLLISLVDSKLLRSDRFGWI